MRWTRLAGAVVHDETPGKARTYASAVLPTPDARVAPLMRVRAYTKKAERAMCAGDELHRPCCEVSVVVLKAGESTARV
jgi:cob(I)alamin adenosyltransferase